MISHPASRPRSFALRLALAYALVAGLWLMLSAAWAQRLAGVDWTPQASQIGSVVLVAMTTAFLYLAALWVARRMSRHDALLRRHELQLGGIVDTAMDAIITVDAAQRIVVFNRAAAEVFRLPAEQALGQSLERFVPARLQAAHRDHVRHFASSGKSSRRMGMLHTLVGLRSDGEEFPMEASVSRLNEGDDVLMTVVLRDATEKGEAERARQSQLAAEAANLAKTRFLARMSHELRTPLNAILGFSDLLLTQPAHALGESASRYVEHIRKAGCHLLALVGDAMDVSRVEAGALQFLAGRVDLHQALDEALTLTQKLAQRHGVCVDPGYRGAMPCSAWCDPLRLRQVLVNLLSNAIKYNRAGGHVHIELERHGETVRLLLDDTGLGMTQEQLAHLYEPFNRLGREHDGVEGTGIGLALSRELVARMNGEMRIDSVAGQGTRVCLVLPAVAPTCEEVQ